MITVIGLTLLRQKGRKSTCSMEVPEDEVGERKVEIRCLQSLQFYQYTSGLMHYDAARMALKELGHLDKATPI